MVAPQDESFRSFSEELLTSGFVYIALPNWNYMKKSLPVNKNKKSWRAIKLIKKK